MLKPIKMNNLQDSNLKVLINMVKNNDEVILLLDRLKESIDSLKELGVVITYKTNTSAFDARQSKLLYTSDVGR